MFMVLLTILGVFAWSNELTTSDSSRLVEVTFEDDTYVPVKWERQRVTRTKLCKPEECGLPQPPVVEGQTLLYIQPPQSNYVQLRKPMTSFFKSWAKRCHDKSTLDQLLFSQPARDNKVMSYSGDISLLAKEDYRATWDAFLLQKDPRILIFLLTSPTKEFNEAEWKKALARIPKYLACLLIAPPTNLRNTQQTKHIKSLQRMIEKTNSSCQIVSADEEMKGLALQERERFFKRDGALSRDGLTKWWATEERHLCNVEPQLLVTETKPKSFNSNLSREGAATHP